MILEEHTINIVETNNGFEFFINGTPIPDDGIVYTKTKNEE